MKMRNSSYISREGMRIQQSFDDKNGVDEKGGNYANEMIHFHRESSLSMSILHPYFVLL